MEPTSSVDARAVAQSRAGRLAITLNLALTLLQLAVGWWSASQALIADALHTLSDLVGDGLLLWANRHSRRPADAGHPYGHQRLETAASLLLGLILLGVAASLIAAAVQRLGAIEAAPPLHPAALLMAAVALVAKEGLYRYLIATARRVRSSLLEASAWHARSDAASSLVVAAGLAGSLAGWPLLDPLAAAAVGLLILRMGARFAWNALHDLVDRAADEAQVEAIAATLRETPGVQGLHDLRTRRNGDLVAVDVHLDIDARLTVAEGHEIAKTARERVLAAHPVLHLMVHVDPWWPPPASDV
jgi:cation diffusion facilitator family transporter